MTVCAFLNRRKLFATNINILTRTNKKNDIFYTKNHYNKRNIGNKVPLNDNIQKAIFNKTNRVGNKCRPRVSIFISHFPVSRAPPYRRARIWRFRVLSPIDAWQVVFSHAPELHYFHSKPDFALSYKKSPFERLPKSI